METVLFLGHTEADGQLNKANLEALSVALDLKKKLASARLLVGLVGAEVQAADSIASVAEQFFSVSGEIFSKPRYGSDAAAAEAIIRQAGAQYVVAAGTSRWQRVLGGVAERVNGCFDSHVFAIEVVDSSPLVSRWYYRQRMQGSLSREGRPWIILVDPGSGHLPWQGEAGKAAVVALEVQPGQSSLRTTVQGIKEPEAQQQTIRPDAELLFVTGAGWTKKQADGQAHIAEASKLIVEFLANTRCSLGSSKSLVDMDSQGEGVLPFLSHLNQVGQTGSSPRHPKGLATCCHGEEPHVIGWRFIRDRRAINTNPNCGWAQGKADVLYVADAFQVMRRLNELLS